MQNQLKLMTLSQLHSELRKQRNKEMLPAHFSKAGQYQARIDMVQSELDRRGETLMEGHERIIRGAFYVHEGELIKASDDGQASNYSGTMHHANIQQREIDEMKDDAQKDGERANELSKLQVT